MNSIRAFLLVLGLAATTLHAADSFDRYPAKTLDGVLVARVDVEKSPYLAKPGSKYFDADPAFGHATVVFEGKMRAIEPETREFLDKWAASAKLPAMTGIFEEEGLFREGSTDYWLPVQKALTGYLRKEAKTGSSVEVWVEWFGSYRSASGKMIHVLGVNKFDSKPAE